MPQLQTRLWEVEVTSTQARNLKRLVEVLTVITGHAGCFPFRETIAQRMGCSVSTMKRALGVGIDLGVVTRQERTTPSGQTSNLYHVEWERLRLFCRIDPLEGLLPLSNAQRFDLLRAADFTSPPRLVGSGTPVQDEPPPVQDEPPPVQDEPPPVQDEPASNKELGPESGPDSIPDSEGGKTAGRSAPPFGIILSRWNSAMCQSCRWTNKRRESLRARWSDPWWREHWQEGIARARASPFLCGENDRGWRADMEFFLRPDSLTKILEGKYDEQHDHSSSRRQTQNARAFAGFLQRRRLRAGDGGALRLEANG